MSTYAPLVSEKSFKGSEQGVYTFKVPSRATKVSIRRDLQTLYGVTIVRVATSHVQPKQRRRGRIMGVRPGFKKAIITLKKGEKIKELEA